MRFALVLLFVGMPLASLAAETASGGYVSPFTGYQGWSEPTVRDWQETHRLISGEPSGHAGHGGMIMPDTSSKPADNAPAFPSHETMPGMDHGSMEMPEGDSHEGMQHGGGH